MPLSMFFRLTSRELGKSYDNCVNDIILQDVRKPKPQQTTTQCEPYIYLLRYTVCTHCAMEYISLVWIDVLYDIYVWYCMHYVVNKIGDHDM